MTLKNLIEQMIREKLIYEKNINDMKVSAEMKSLLQMRNISSSGSKAGYPEWFNTKKREISKEIGKVINQLKRKEEGKSSKYDQMLPGLVKQYQEILDGFRKVGGGNFKYQPPSDYTDGRE